jgi:acyl-CoA thioester hydrolase
VEPFRLTLPVRHDDLDTNGHVRGPAYLALADHARWAVLDAAGIDLAVLAEHHLGPVNLETTVRFRAELRPGDQVEILTRFEFGDGKTDRVSQVLRRADGTVSAEITSVTGLLDLDRRRLVDRPSRWLRRLATHPDVLGLRPGDR